MIWLLAITAVLVLAVVLFMQQEKFGKRPSGTRLEVIKKSPNYRDGAFQNINETPNFAEDVNFFTAMRGFLFGKDKRNVPADEIPSVKTDLKQFDPSKDVLIWFGHSSYFMQIDGKRFLVDPVFSGAASPVPFNTKAFKGANSYTVDDLPEIDYLFISHDHWDHLDHQTVKKLIPKVKKVVTGLGTGEHLEYWGYDPAILIEKDWNETIPLEDSFVAYSTPARHFSGRGFKRDQALWTSWVLQTPSMKVYLGGDSGYDTHFADIGEKFGPFDLAILENGQYNRMWKHIHLMPGEMLKATRELKAKALLPVHSGKFSIAMHAWDEPLKSVTQEMKGSGIKLITPMIGEEVRLKDSSQVFKEWWKGLN